MKTSRVTYPGRRSTAATCRRGKVLAKRRRRGHTDCFMTDLAHRAPGGGGGGVAAHSRQAFVRDGEGGENSLHAVA